jgi:N-glycosylase/DNA lyase
MAKAIAFGQGMRILRQDHWETLVSFIISQNNNIGRIKGCIASLCENFGAFAGEYKGKKYFTLPEAGVLAALTEEDLAVCRLGYRAKYLIETAKAVKEDNGVRLSGLRKANANEAFVYLTSLCGVGPKVANCIMLFSMDQYDSFPIDVWVKQAMNKLYGFDKQNTKAMAEYAEKNFGGYGGIAQQYLFYYIKSL